MDLHVKSTDRHQFPHYTSSHPEHTKRSIVFGQYLRVCRICSIAQNFRKHTTEMKSWFYKSGYPKGLVEKEMGKIKFSGYNRRNKRKKKGVFFVITYHPSLENIGGLSIKTYIFNIWMKMLKAYLHRLQWFFSAVWKTLPFRKNRWFILV